MGQRKSSKRIFMCSEKKVVYPFGNQILEKMYEKKYIKSHFFFSLEGKGQIHNKNSVFQLISSQFHCSRLVIAEEPCSNSSNLHYHAIIELSPAMLWRSVYARLRSKISE